MANRGEASVDRTGEESIERLVSNGSLPTAEAIETAIAEAYRRYRWVSDGTNATHYPALADVDPSLFGIAVVSTTGRVFTIGDAQAPFTIMSVAKPFVLALVLEMVGPEVIRTRVGLDSTGYPFDACIPIERSPDHTSNPMVNTGALVTTSLVPGSTAQEQWSVVREGLSRFAGRSLDLDAPVLESALASNQRNRALASLLASHGTLRGEPTTVVDLYTRQSSLSVTAVDLAVMGATLAGGGVNPVTDLQVVSADVCRQVLAVMATAGLYETSGRWLFDVGLPGKSGVGGGIVTVSPGKGSLGTFAPPLDPAGNSVRGQLVARYLSRRLGLDLFSSAPGLGSAPFHAAKHIETGAST